MSDMNFENLPSTSTPITAENLNKLNDVKVSSTEPATDRRKVWIKKGKNVFNAYQYTYYLRNSSENYVINSANSISVSGNNMSWSRVGITVKNLLPNTKYTISASVSNPSAHWAGIIVAEDGTEKNSISTNTSFNPRVTFTSSNNGTIAINLFSNWSSSSLTETVVFNQIQLEQGENKTTYEAYVEPSIYIKNDNGVYEEFYSEDKIINNDNGTAIKYSNGTMICLKRIEINATINKAWGNIFETSAKVDFGNFASAFRTMPQVFIQNVSNMCWIEAIGETTTQNVGKSHLARPISTNSNTYIFDVFAIGKWK